jgi:pimeloyl-ACP methyl ester carboxylesterase
MGHSMGVQLALEFHRRHPERVQALVLVCGSPGHLLDIFHDTPCSAARCPRCAGRRSGSRGWPRR